jgi:hypothetical protein
MSNTTNRLSLKVLADELAQARAESAAQRAEIAELTATVSLLTGTAKATDAPKRTTRRTAKKAAAKKAAAPTKGAQPKAALGRKEWNHTLSAKARLAGKRADGTTVYRAVMDAWADVQADREAGLTPDQVVAKYRA